MKIYRTVNPVAYENTYYLENDHSLIPVSYTHLDVYKRQQIARQLFH